MHHQSTTLLSSPDQMEATYARPMSGEHEKRGWEEMRQDGRRRLEGLLQDRQTSAENLNFLADES